MKLEDRRWKTLQEKNGDVQQTKRFRKAKRGAAIVGTAMVGCSVAAPLVQPVPVQADETPVQFGARINTAAFITEIATYAQPIAQANDLYASVMIAQAVVESGWAVVRYLKHLIIIFLG